MLMEMRFPSEFTTNAVRLTTGSLVSIACRRAHSLSHVLARNTSERRWPMACSDGVHVICSAARLKGRDARISLVRDALQDRVGSDPRRARGRRCLSAPDHRDERLRSPRLVSPS